MKVLPGDSPEHGSTSKILNHLKEIITEVDEETGKVAVAQEYGQLSWPKVSHDKKEITKKKEETQGLGLLNPSKWHDYLILMQRFFCLDIAEV